MSDEKSKSLDVLGIAPFGEALNTSVTKTFDGVGAFLGLICLPAAEEFGLLLRDRIGRWRLNNLAKITKKAEKQMRESGRLGKDHAHPRLAVRIVEEGSWAATDDVQSMWAGLLSSACSEDGLDESNLIFVNLLSQISAAQARILEYACENAEKLEQPAGIVIATHLEVDTATLRRVSRISAIYVIDRDLDHLRSLELIHGGFHEDADIADITPSALALNLYTRCRGSSASPSEYFGTKDRVAQDL